VVAAAEVNMQATCWLLLACTAAIAASAAAQNASAKSPADVIVVGAGVSGLSAAAALQAAGYSVIVVEARDRLGGRLHTVSFNKTKGKVDLGGAWIHGLDGNPITNIADTNQLSYVPTSTTDGTAYWSNGTELPEALATQQEQLLTGLKGYNSKWIDSQEGASAGVNTSLADLMTEFTDSKSLGALQQLLLAAAVDGAVVAEYAASPGNLSARYGVLGRGWSQAWVTAGVG
jgi:phytoene dehydrogenase-like protein